MKKSKIDEIVDKLCYRLDMAVYFPTKRELEKYRGIQYSLGFRKEEYKKFIRNTLNELKEGDD